MVLRNDCGEITQLLLTIDMEGRTAYTMAIYYVDGLLIDSGPVRQRQEFMPFLDELEVDTVVNTHHHEDHIGNNPVFAERGIPILAHSSGVSLISDTSIWTPQLLYYQQCFFDLPPSSPCQAVGDHVDSRKYRFHVIHTPGHSPDHIALFEERNGWLFTGDLFRSVKVTHLRRNEDFSVTMASLEGLLNYDFQTIFCAGGRIYQQGKEKLREKIEWSKDLQAKALSLKEGGMDHDAIRDQLLGPENIMAQFTEGDYTKLNMIEAVLK
jgi:glyoxylase-like metal-dependent hydrolase (beta-lactamase superfamily II)